MSSIVKKACNILEKHYKKFTIVDFAVDEAFLKHYLSPSIESNDFWNNWLEKNPEKRSDCQEASNLIYAVQKGLTSYTRTYLSEDAEAHLLSRILETNRKTEEGQPSNSWKSIGARSLVAASVVLLLGIAGYFIYSNQFKSTIYTRQMSASNDSIFEKVNQTQEIQHYILPDSTKVTLAPASKIGYRLNQENSTVYLSGKAEFNVKKNPHKPFLVYANETVSRVLGTQFEVSAFDQDSEVVVKVKSGKVTVYQNDELGHTDPLKNGKTGVFLMPNQLVVFKRKEQKFTKEIVGDPLVVVNIEEAPSFIYEDTPISVVFMEIVKAYGLEIDFNAKTLSNCEFTGSLTDESLMEKLDIICSSIGATYEIVEARMIINAKGCEPNN
jgi:transmembrane sensor